MSLFTQMPIERYPDDATRGFKLAEDFDLGTARALAWMSQLAYETDKKKVRDICTRMNIALVGDLIHRDVKTGLPVASTYVMVLDLGPALVVSFAGTDPVLLANWISDFDIRPTDGGSAEGFAVAMQAVEGDVLLRLPADRPVMVTGHSLGGALAVLLAAQLAKLQRNVAAVYTFGMPRPGRRPFTDSYDLSLGARTFRLVHGEDILPTDAPSEPFGFHHVGRYVTAPRAGRVRLPPAPRGSDEPAFAKGIAKEWRELLHNPIASVGAYAAQLRLAANALAGRPAPGSRTDPAGILIEMLPLRIRDHMPDRYIAACSP